MDIKSNKGISLVEVIVTVAIMAIIIVPVSMVFITSYTNFISESDKTTAEQCAREVLYGKGITSYGVIGDLERSNAKSSEISVINNDATSSSSITIPYTDDKGYKGIKEYIFKDGILNFKDYNTTNSEDFFKDEKSSNKDINVIGFSAEMKQKGTDIDTDPSKETIINTNIIKITVTVKCGRSGQIKLESSYRINVED